MSQVAVLPAHTTPVDLMLP